MGNMHASRLLHRLNDILNKAGFGQVSLVSRVKDLVRPHLVNVAPDNSVLIKIDGLSFYIYANTWDFHAYFDRPFEPYTVELFKRAIKPGSRVLDIGAQFGHYSLLAAKRVGPGGKVYAFEPAPPNFKLLERNIRVNGYEDRIEALRKGVGETNTASTLYLYEGSDSHGMYRIPEARVKETTTFECVGLDEFLSGQQIDVIKMDIEGNEPYALKGMTNTLLRNDHLVLFTELAPTFLRRAGVEPEKYVAQLEGFGFEVRLIDETACSLNRVTPDVLRKSDKDPAWYANLYCLKGASD